MIVTMLFTVEGARPEISRCVNVESDLDLSRLAQIIDASLGFSGAAGHLFIHQDETKREVFAENPGPGERSMSSMQVGDMPPLLYVYDPAANWNVNVRRIGQSGLEGPTPLLVHAQGPDVVETANGPEMMTRLHEEARNLAAGLPPNMEITPLLLGCLPVMTPDRMLDRLSVVDQVAVATRMGFVGEELDVPSAQPPHFDDLPDQDLTMLLDAFIEQRPDLKEILDTDPNPHSNPTLIAAFQEFFEDTMVPVGDGAVDMHAPKGFSPVLAQYLETLGERAPLTTRGKLKVNIVRALIDVLDLPSYLSQPREDTWDAIVFGRFLLEKLGFLTRVGNSLLRTPEGTDFLANPSIVGREAEFADACAEYFGDWTWDMVVEFLTGDLREPASPLIDDALDTLMVLGGVFEMGDVNVITGELTAVLNRGKH